jgi:hypothetical protein
MHTIEQTDRCGNAVKQKTVPILFRDGFLMVPGVGVEPTRLAATDFKSVAYTIPPPGHILFADYEI